MMRAAVLRSLVKSPREIPAMTEVPMPVADPDSAEVVVRIEAAGVNLLDVLMSQGKYQVQPPLPFVLGTEYAGVVESAGAKSATKFPPGTRVYGLNEELGAYAEFMKVTRPNPLSMRLIP
jgi:NADPH2:quinone reductase